MIYHYEYFVWAVLFAFYAFDNFRLYSHDDILIQETLNGEADFVLSAVPFTLSGKVVFLCNFLMPWTFCFRFKWMALPCDNWAVLEEMERIALWTSRLGTFRFIGAAAAVNLFLLGPALTALSGFRTAALTAIAEHALLLAFAAWELRSQKALLALSDKAIAAMMFELIAAPGYLPNICKRLSLSRAIAPVDGGLFFALCGRMDRRGDLRDALRMRLQDLEAAAGAEGAEREKARAYGSRLGI